MLFSHATFRPVHRTLLSVLLCLLVILSVLARQVVAQSPDGGVDPSFEAPVLEPYAAVTALAIQPDGKIIVGRMRTSYGEGVSPNGIIRLNTDGSLDMAFAANGGTDSDVQAVALQPDGKIVIGGWFSSVNGVSRQKIARLNADGSLDLTFDPGTGANDDITALALQPDGKVVVGGRFTSVNGISRSHIARLNADGSLDLTFDPGTVSVFIAFTLALQPDGKILIGGDFTTVNGISRNRIARLNADGSLDLTFDPGTGVMGLVPRVVALVLQPDGKVVIGGFFRTVNNVRRGSIARLNTDGTLDPTFSPGMEIMHIYTLALQPDGKIIYGSSSVSNNRVTRLNTDGSRDLTFDPSTGAINAIYTLALQPDGKILIGGDFTTVNGVSRIDIARLHNTIEAPRLFLSPATTTIGSGQTFQLDLQFDTAGRIADTVDGYLHFDPAVLEVIDDAGHPATSITANSAVVGSVSYNRVDAATGQIDFSASTYESPYLTGRATAATIRFRAKAPVDSTPVQLIRTGLRQSDLFLGGTRLNVTLGHATVQITEGARICGRIAVEQRGPAGTPRWITPLFRTEGATTTGGVTLYQPGSTTEVARFAATTDADGRFCVTATGVPVGIYDVRVKGANTLSTQRANVDLRTATEVSYGTLLVGDSSGDDGVTGADVSYIIPAFLSRIGEAGFRPYADTNRDDEITGADVSALIPNFLRGGPIAVTGAAQPEPQESRVQSGTPPQITLSPARQQVQLGEIVPVELKVELGSTSADTVDLHVTVDPALLDIVDTTGQPVRSLTVNRSAFADVTYNRVDAATGQISLSASRLTAPAATGSLTVATLYVRAKQHFTTTPLTVATTGTRRADVFARGQSLQPILTGSTLSMGDLYRTYIPQASQ